MSVYRLYIERAVFKQLKNIPQRDYQKLMDAIAELAINPRPFGHIKLKNRAAYRIRQGNYRIIYEINDNILLVTVVEAGDRKDIYD